HFAGKQVGIDSAKVGPIRDAEIGKRGIPDRLPELVHVPRGVGGGEVCEQLSLALSADAIKRSEAIDPGCLFRGPNRKGLAWDAGEKSDFISLIGGTLQCSAEDDAARIPANDIKTGNSDVGKLTQEHGKIRGARTTRAPGIEKQCADAI